jgi:hypothetical protein
VPEDKPSTDRAFELLVYAPIGAVMYARDMMPTMIGIFVNRGKREVQSHRAPSPPPVPSAPDVRRRVEDSFGMAKGAAAGGVGLAKGAAATSVGLARDVAGTALAGFVQRRGTNGGDAVATAGVDTTTRADAAASKPVAPTAPSVPSVPSVPSAASAPSETPAVDSLPIPDYDELSASQVVERLAGLDPSSLDAIRRYESAHRGRNTILGKIAQLS